MSCKSLACAITASIEENGSRIWHKQPTACIEGQLGYRKDWGFTTTNSDKMWTVEKRRFAVKAFAFTAVHCQEIRKELRNRAKLKCLR